MEIQLKVMLAQTVLNLFDPTLRWTPVPPHVPVHPVPTTEENSQVGPSPIGVLGTWTLGLSFNPLLEFFNPVCSQIMDCKIGSEKSTLYVLG